MKGQYRLPQLVDGWIRSNYNLEDKKKGRLQNWESKVLHGQYLRQAREIRGE